jgi:hypothetical protein
MKKGFMYLAMMLLCGISAGATSKTVNVAKAGTLNTLISANEKYTITDLTVSGDLNGDDIRLIRDMGGRNSQGEETEGKLQTLNMLDSRIVSGGGYYSSNKTTTDDWIGYWMLAELKITSLILPKGIVRIYEGACKGCENLHSVQMPSTLKRIDRLAFAYCDLTNIEIPEGVNAIDAGAFCYNFNLGSVTLPSTITFIGKSNLPYTTGVFDHCKSLTEIKSRMTTPFAIDSLSFQYIDLTKMYLYVPKGTVAAYKATAGWNAIKNIVEETTSTPLPYRTVILTTPGTLQNFIPEAQKNTVKKLTLIGKINGTDIRYINEMAGITSSGAGTDGILKDLDLSKATIVSGGAEYRSGQTTKDNTLTAYMFNRTHYARIMLPENLVSIEDYSLVKVDSITSITIPASVKYISSANPFRMSACLENINVDAGNVNFKSEGGALFSANGDTLKVCPAANGYYDYINAVPEGVKDIGNNAFYGNKEINSIILPSTLNRIEDYGFYLCSNLSLIQLNSTTPPALGKYTFLGLTKANCELHVPKASLLTYQQTDEWKDFKLSGFVSGNVTINVATAGTLSTLIDEYSLELITGLKLTGELNGTDIKYIRKAAGVDNLSNESDGELTLGDLDLSGAKIVAGGDPYAYDGNLSSPLFTANNVVGKSMFQKCYINSVILPSGTTEIGEKAFYTASVETVGIPAGVTKIGTSAFEEEDLQAIHSLMIKPVAISSFNYCFKGVNKTQCKLYLPTGTRPAYANSIGWNEFTHVVEEDAGVENVRIDSNAKVTAVGNEIIIRDGEIGTPVAVYAISGVQMTAGQINDEYMTIAMPTAGMYIVKTGSKATKVIVR